MRTSTSTLLICVLVFGQLAGCGGGGGGGNVSTPPPPPPPPPPPTGAPSVTVDADIKELIFSWTEVTGSTHYKLLENPDGSSGFTQVGADIPAGTLSLSLPIAVHFHDFGRALYIVEACDAAGCTGSSEVNAMNSMIAAIGYFKASNPDEFDYFGTTVALSADGNTLAVGTNAEESNANGINGDQNDNSQFDAGAVYVFRFDGVNWAQQAYVKASNTEFSTWFGMDVSLSSDGNTMVVGAPLENSNAVGVNGDQNNDLAWGSGAAYVFRYDGTNWTQQAYLKASNTDELDEFGRAVGMSADGNTVAVGAVGEDSSATGVNGNQGDNSIEHSGAVYVYQFDGAAWSQQAYIKASNTDEDQFGGALSLSADGNTMVVGASFENSNAVGVNGDQNNDLAWGSGAAYVFRYDGTNWTQQAYLKASNTDESDQFGGAVGMSADGNTLAVGAHQEDSSATGVNGNQDDNSIDLSGAVYVYQFDGAAWSQQAYVKASNADPGDRFGGAVAISADGNILAAGAIGEDSVATGVNGDQNDNSAFAWAGAAYVYRFDGTDWAQQAYVKASNTRAIWGRSPSFGSAVALSADGNTLAAGAYREDSNATGVNGNQNDESARSSGAVYVY